MTASGSHQAPSPIEPATIPGQTPGNPPGDLPGRVSQLLARLAVQRFLALTRGADRDETTQESPESAPAA